MDAFPGYSYFDSTKKVLCVIQVIEDAEGTTENRHTVMGHKETEDIDIAKDDSTVTPSTLVVTLTTAPVIGNVETAVEGSAVTATLTTAPVCTPDVVSYTLSGNTIAEVAVADKNVPKEATVTYAVDATKLTAYNTANGTSYTSSDVELPENSKLTWTVADVTTG